jgi:AraC-like DNA-binding protein
MLSIRIGKSVYALFNDSWDLNIMQIGLSACFLIGVCLFYYIKSSVDNSKIIPLSWKLHFGFLLTLTLVVGLLWPYATHRDLWRTVVFATIYSSWGIYIGASAFVLKGIFQKLIKKGVKCTTPELWLIYIWVANLLVFVAYLIGYFWLYLAGTLTFSFVFYGLVIFLLTKKNRDTVFKELPQKYVSKKIDEKDAEKMIGQLHTLMIEKELFKNVDVKLKDIAKELSISSHQLSQLLNDNIGKSFASFLNEYRVEEAKKLLKENNQYTLEAIGYEAGFSSKSTFYATFKKVLGATPAAYKKQFLP